MSYLQPQLPIVDHYRHHTINIFPDRGIWRYRCHRPYAIEWFSDGKAYEKPLSARTAARRFINFHCTFVAIGDVLQEWVETGLVNDYEYVAATDELIQMADHLLFSSP